MALPISSLDEVDFFGIRATSTTTAEGSIKGVSGDPETTGEPEEPGDPEAQTYDKVFFSNGVDSDGVDKGGFFILSEEPENNEFNVPALPAGTEPTFANYLAYFEENGGDVTQVQSVVFYAVDDEGLAQELFSIDAPEGGFADSDALLAAYDEAIDGLDAGLELMAALTIESDQDNEFFLEDDDEPAEISVL